MGSLSPRLVSENGIWEVGFRQMIFGVRVSAGRIDPDYEAATFYAIDYCAGRDRAFCLQLFATVVILLSALPESVSERQVMRLFPSYTVKPIVDISLG
jgi:hypothetical protein